MQAPRNDMKPPKLRPPGPRGLPFLGVLPKFLTDRLDYLQALQEKYGDIVSLSLGRRQCYLITHPDDVQRILLDEHDLFPKPKEMEVMRPLLGYGLLTSEGKEWKRQRRLSLPAFHHQRFSGFVPGIQDACAVLLERWGRAERDGVAIDVAEEMTRVTLQVIGRIMLGSDLKDDFECISDSLTAVLRHLHYKAWLPIRLPERTPLLGYQAYRKGLQALDDIVYRIIDEHQASNQDHGDLLSMLLRPHPESGERFTRSELRDQVMTILLAGHETTANALAWTWYLLDQNPKAWDRLQQELDEVLGRDRTRSVTFEDAAKLSYTGRVVEESLRLYPTVTAIYRAPARDFSLRDYHLPAGSLLMLSAYTTHRRPDIWENPTTFDPERFLPEASEHRHRYAYYPFGAGPRICVGMSLAMMEAKLILATVASKYKPTLKPDHKVIPIPATTLRMRDGLMMTLNKI